MIELIKDRGPLTGGGGLVGWLVQGEMQGGLHHDYPDRFHRSLCCLGGGAGRGPAGGVGLVGEGSDRGSAAAVNGG